MKRSSLLGVILFMLSMAIPAMGAMSTSKIRENSRFLTDRMAYELNLSNYQYDDVYEVNYDFLRNVRYLLDDVARGIPRAVDQYYDFLDIRNDDLRWILSNNQYRRFMNEDYFYRPVYAQNNRWQLRIFFVYTNVNFFYFGKPRHYSSYKGGHYRSHHHNISFYQKRYKQRYKHDLYRGNYNIRSDKRRYEEHKKNDFGPASKPSHSRPSTNRPGSNNNNNSSTNRPGSNNNNNSSTNRPGSNNNNNSSTNRPGSNNNNNSSTNRPSTSRPASGSSRPATGSSSNSQTKDKRESRPANDKSSNSRERTRNSKTERESESNSSRR